MTIRKIRKKELKEAYFFQDKMLNPAGKKRYRTFSYVKKQFNRHPNLFVGCFDKRKLMGVIFGYVKKTAVLLGEFAVSSKCRKRKIGTKLLYFFEKEAKKLRKKKICLGSREEAEKFYLKKGYSPFLFVQIRKKDIPRNFSEIKNKYNIIKQTNYTDGPRLVIKVKRLNSRLKGKVKKDFKAYDVIYVFEKIL